MLNASVPDAVGVTSSGHERSSVIDIGLLLSQYFTKLAT